MAVFDFNEEYNVEVPVRYPNQKTGNIREIKLPVSFNVLSEEDYQSMLKAVNGSDLEEANSWLYKMVNSVASIAGKERDDRGNPLELDPSTEGRDFAIKNPLIRRAIVKKYVMLSQSNTFQG